MNLKKFLFKLWLCICGAITIALLCVFTAEVMGVNDLSAHAVDTILTPQQTLALLGTEIEGNYYNATTGLSTAVNAVFVGSTDDSDLWLWNERDSVVPNTLIPFYSSPAAHNQYNYTSGLIYRVWFPVGMVSSNSDLTYNLYFSFPFDLHGLQKFEMPVYYSRVGNVQYSSRTNANLNTSLGLQTYNLNNAGVSRMYFYGGTKSSDSVCNFGLLPINYSSDNDNLFSVTDLFCGFNACRGLEAQYIDDVPAGTVAEYWYLIIECPVLNGFTPATTTRPQPTIPPLTLYTTRSNRYDHSATTPANTLDLSQIEENQRLQIEIENDNRNYNAGTFDGVNIIIQKLDNIYALMQSRGEIAVNLLPAPSLPVDSDISDYINNNLDSFTTAQLPDETLTGGIGFIGSLVSWFTESFGWLWLLAALNLSLAVLSFAIFRSKGG